MLQPGDVVAGRYQVVRHLGSGGMASVYKVWDRERAVHLALKMLRPELAHSAKLIGLFQREAHHLESLSHPQIVRFYEMVWDGDDVFLLMEYVEGQTLRRELDIANGPLSLSRIREILAPICTALYYAHTRDIVHCDLKPGNILIDRTGKTFISDFGIAQVMHTMEDLRTAGNLTGAGSPAYMAPEQARQETPSPSSDLYSLGIVLYEMLTGQRPFNGYSAPNSITAERDRVAWEKLNIIPTFPSKINPRIPVLIDTVVLRCLNPQTRYRYTSALDLHNNFEKAFIGDAARQSADEKIEPQNAVEPTRKSSQRRGAIPQFFNTTGFWVAFAAILAVILIGFFALTGRRNGLSIFTGSLSTAMSIQETGMHDYSSACMTFEVPNQPRTQLQECVEKIEVLADGKLKVHMAWTAHGVSNVYGVKVGADTGNPKMYMMDDQGNRLDHIETGGGANEEVALFNGQSKKGWFLFPVPSTNARYLYFHDEDNGGITPKLEQFR